MRELCAPVRYLLSAVLPVICGARGRFLPVSNPCGRANACVYAGSRPHNNFPVIYPNDAHMASNVDNDAVALRIPLNLREPQNSPHS